MKSLKKKLTKQFSKILLSLFALNLVFASGIEASAATGATVSYEVTGELKKGNVVDIALNVKDATDIYGASWDFAYDTTMFEIQSITPGTVFPSNVNVPVKKTATVPGLSEFAMTLTGSAKATATSGTLATMKVKLLKDGKVTLKTSNSDAALAATGINFRVKLATSTAANISYTATDKEIVVVTDPIPVPSKLTSFTNDKPSSQKVGTTINFTAAATPAATSHYTFSISDGKTWTTVQNSSSKNTFAWTPTVAGNYTIRVSAVNTASAGSASDSKDILFTIENNTVDKVSKLTSFKADKPNGQKVGTTINFTALATPADSTQYSFFVKDGVGAWKNVQAYSSTNTFAWKPTVSGVYTVRVHAKYTGSSVATDGYQDILFAIKDNSAPVTSKLTSFKSSLPSGQPVGTKINFAATADPASKALYSFYVKSPGSTTWVREIDYSFKNNFDFTPTVKGTYTIRVHCMNINSPNASTDGYLDMTFEIK